MKKIKIYEFVGIPGSGKTTVFNSVKNGFNNVYTRQELSDIYLRKSKVINLSSLIYCEYSNRLNKFIDDYKESPHFIKEALLSLYITTRLVKLLHPNLSFIYDEGFIQNISAIPYRDELKDNKILNKLINSIKKGFDVNIVFFDVDNKEAIKRIRNRGSKNRFETLDDKDLNEYLNTKRDNIKMLLNKFDKIYLYNNLEELNKILLGGNNL